MIYLEFFIIGLAIGSLSWVKQTWLKIWREDIYILSFVLMMSAALLWVFALSSLIDIISHHIVIK